MTEVKEKKEFKYTGGRKPGVRNKTALEKAQKIIDNAMPLVARNLLAIATRDVEALAALGINPEDITPKLVIDAARQLQQYGFSKNAVLSKQNADATTSKGKVKPEAAAVFQSSVTPLKKVK